MNGVVRSLGSGIAVCPVCRHGEKYYNWSVADITRWLQKHFETCAPSIAAWLLAEHLMEKP